jgi:hypothetical protein
MMYMYKARNNIFLNTYMYTPTSDCFLKLDRIPAVSLSTNMIVFIYSIDLPFYYLYRDLVRPSWS